VDPRKTKAALEHKETKFSLNKRFFHTLKLGKGENHDVGHGSLAKARRGRYRRQILFSVGL
jgi:hypothetical protein